MLIRKIILGILIVLIAIEGVYLYQQQQTLKTLENQQVEKNKSN